MSTQQQQESVTRKGVTKEQHPPVSSTTTQQPSGMHGVSTSTTGHPHLGEKGVSTTTGPVHSANKPIELLIMEDHNEVRSLYKNFQNAATKEEATRWYNQLVWEIARHSVAEEVVVYPLFEDKLGDWGKHRAELSRKEHHTVKVELKELESLSHDDVSFMPKMKTMMANLENHMEHEEKEDLLRLRDTISEHDRVSYGRSFERRKTIVPTRPHPSAPDKYPTFETLVGLLAAPIDKFRDMFRDYPEKEELRNIQRESRVDPDRLDKP